MTGLSCLPSASPANTRSCIRKCPVTPGVALCPPGTARQAQPRADVVMQVVMHLLRSWGTCAGGPTLTDSAVMSPCVKSEFPNQLCRYGYVTNSKVKFVMVVDSSNTALRDNEIRSVSVGTSDLIFPVSLEMLRSPQHGSSCASM